jgi:tetraacyldisaccharide 4'-kinase
VRVIAVGGATLGGSGKTPLAIACARHLAEAGVRVALVAHGYRARPGAARVVHEDDGVRYVGDEALLAARALRGLAPVVVAPRRQAALDRAAALADVVILDGVLQTAPEAAWLSVLALDAREPWGGGARGAVVPCGDLRAPRAALLEQADIAVALGDADIVSSGASGSGRHYCWDELRRLRVGLFVALSRPHRVLGFLSRRGVVPARVVEAPDHGVPAGELRRLFEDRSQPAGKVDLWLATPKCALHLEEAQVPHVTLEHALRLPPELAQRLAQSWPRDWRGRAEESAKELRRNLVP